LRTCCFSFYCHASCPSLCSFPTRRSSDLFALGYRQDFSGDLFSVEFEPVRCSAAADQFQGSDNLNVFLHFLFDTDLLTDRDLERSEEHTSELQSLRHLVCRLLLEKKKKNS